MAHSVDATTTDSRTLVMDKTISTFSGLPSSILRSEEQVDIITLRPKHPLSSSRLSVPFSKRFFDTGDPEVERARAIYFKAYFVGMGLVILTIFLVFSIYWGSLWRLPDTSLQGWIVVRLSSLSCHVSPKIRKDFDGADVGQAVTRGLLDSRTWMVRWRSEPAERYPNGVHDIIEAIRDDAVWVAVASKYFRFSFAFVYLRSPSVQVNSRATQNLQNAVSLSDSSYNGSLAITVYASEARNENA